VLDIFAGTGALAIEAISRGAATALCIESGKSALTALRRNVCALGVGDSLRIAAADFRTALRAQAAAGVEFDGVFVDAPYAKGLTEEALEMLDAGGLVAEQGWIAVETARREIAPRRVGSLVMQREDEYGDTKLLLYERLGDVAGEAASGGDQEQAGGVEPQPAEEPEENQ